MYGMLPIHMRFTPTRLPHNFIVPIILSNNSEIQVTFYNLIHIVSSYTLFRSKRYYSCPRVEVG
jgi:hypothetical protein